MDAQRARLIAASFLTKDLHLDWRAGEAHFMRHLLCGDEAQNNGTASGSRRSASIRRRTTRCPYNPVAQQAAAGCVIGRDYPAPIVDHGQERERALARYRAVTG